jgi:hypothetical protein
MFPTRIMFLIYVVLYCFFVYVHVSMPCVWLMPFGDYCSYISLHLYIDPLIKCETLKTFSKLQLIFGCTKGHLI